MVDDPSSHRTSHHSSGPHRPPLGALLSLLLVLGALTVAGLLLFAPHPPRLQLPAPVAQEPATAPAALTTPTAVPVPVHATETTAPTATTGSQTPAVTPPPAVVAAAAPETLAPGLTLLVETPDGASDRRSARVMALHVAAGEAPTPFLPAGPFTATWDGYITLDIRNRITFTAEGTGSLTITVNGKPALERTGPSLAGTSKAIRMSKGTNHVVATYHSPASGASQVRVFWASDDFPEEPLPATVFTHDIADAALKKATRLHRGRELLGTDHCTRCHTSTASADTGLPELATDAPDLREIGARLNPAWIAAWIADPKALRPNATMPRLLHGGDLAAQATDIAAYLATQGKPVEDLALSAPDTAAGARLFATLGCVACHSASGDKPAYIDLSHVKAKWRSTALSEFLQKPNRHYAWIRMPDFALSADQARQLVAYLFSCPQQTVSALSSGNAEHGKALIAEHGCASCHQLGEGTGSALHAAPLAEVTAKLVTGCLASDDASRGNAPDFGFSGGDLLALRAVFSSDPGLKSLTRRSLPEFAERRITALRCAACHERDGQDALINGFHAETDAILAGLPPEPPAPGGTDFSAATESAAASSSPCPALTFTGDKLRPEWMGDFIAGKIPYRTRPWLAKHMPFFPSGAELLAQGLAEEHGLPPVTPPEAPNPAAPAADIGKTLTTNNGLSCTACHAVGSQKALLPGIVPGINFAYVSKRLQKDYFHRWLLFPMRFDAKTLMPRFSSDGVTTQRTDILGGKADDQFEAIWQYLRTLPSGN